MDGTIANDSFIKSHIEYTSSRALSCVEMNSGNEKWAERTCGDTGYCIMCNMPQSNLIATNSDSNRNEMFNDKFDHFLHKLKFNIYLGSTGLFYIGYNYSYSYSYDYSNENDSLCNRDDDTIFEMNCLSDFIPHTGFYDENSQYTLYLNFTFTTNNDCWENIVNLFNNSNVKPRSINQEIIIFSTNNNSSLIIEKLKFDNYDTISIFDFMDNNHDIYFFGNDRSCQYIKFIISLNYSNNNNGSSYNYTTSYNVEYYKAQTGEDCPINIEASNPNIINSNSSQTMHPTSVPTCLPTDNTYIPTNITSIDKGKDDIFSTAINIDIVIIIGSIAISVIFCLIIIIIVLITKKSIHFQSGCCPCCQQKVQIVYVKKSISSTQNSNSNSNSNSNLNRNAIEKLLTTTTTTTTTTGGNTLLSKTPIANRKKLKPRLKKLKSKNDYDDIDIYADPNVDDRDQVEMSRASSGREGAVHGTMEREREREREKRGGQYNNNSNNNIIDMYNINEDEVYSDQDVGSFNFDVGEGIPGVGGQSHIQSQSQSQQARLWSLSNVNSESLFGIHDPNKNGNAYDNNNNDVNGSQSGNVSTIGNGITSNFGFITNAYQLPRETNDADMNAIYDGANTQITLEQSSVPNRTRDHDNNRK